MADYTQTVDDSLEDTHGQPRQVPEGDLRVGVTVGRFIVLERVGAGGMGVVYAAFDPQLDRKVALKVLRSTALAAHPGLLNEARTQAGFAHANIVATHELGTFADQVFIVMDFMKATLRQWLAERPRSRADILARFLEAGAGLAAAHSRAIVHRDFKPDNVMIDENGVARVTDFGLARAAGAPGGRGGTTGYLAPEGATGTVSPAVDQYAWCVAVWEALSGGLPGQGDASRIPAWLRRVLQRGLAQRAEDRYPTMAALLVAVRADPARARRGRLLAVGVALALSTSAVLLAAALMRETPRERATRLCNERVAQAHDAVWGPARVDRLTSAFRRVTTTGEATLARVRARLEPEIAAWQRLASTACGLDQEDPVRQRLSRCLNERLATLEGLTALFATADAQVVNNADTTVSLEVMPVASCEASQTARPGDTSSGSVDDGRTPSQLDTALALARVKRAAGRLGDALKLAEQIADDAHAQGNVRLEADATLLLGRIRADRRDADAEDLLKRALLLAERIGADASRAQAWTSLVGWYASRGMFVDATLADSHAAAIVSRLGSQPLLEAERLMQLGQFDLQQRDKGHAVQAFTAALALRQQQLPADHPLVINARLNLASTLEPELALVEFEAILVLRERQFGPDHPETASALVNAGVALLELKRCEAARVYLERAVAVRLDDRAGDPVRLAKTHATLARALSCLDRLSEAIVQQREAIAALDESHAPADQLGREVRMALRYLRAAGRPSLEQAPLDARLKQLEEADRSAP